MRTKSPYTGKQLILEELSCGGTKLRHVEKQSIAEELSRAGTKLRHAEKQSIRERGILAKRRRQTDFFERLNVDIG
jgi:hypothetical protein